MPAIEWNSGLQIGVDMIDKDHKALIALINELYGALEREATKEIIKGIFDRLEDYIRYHFAREEALMGELNFDGIEDHVRQHRQFTTDVESLKDKLLNRESEEVVERVTHFLTNWVTMHIVSEDTKLAHAVLCKKPRRRYYGIINQTNQLAHWFSKKLAFPYRVLLMVLIPISAILVFSTITIWGDYNKYKEAEELVELLDVIRDSGTLIHHLQAERGLTIANINSGYTKFNDRISLLQQRTDAAASVLMKRINTTWNKKESQFSKWQKQALKNWSKNITGHRIQVSERLADSNVLMNTYTDFIGDLLSVADYMMKMRIQHHLDNSILASISIMYFKEKVGLVRAIGSKVIGRGEISPNDLEVFLELLGEQRGFLKTFERTASLKQRKLLEQLQNSEVFVAAMSLEASMVAAWREGALSDIKNMLWWDTQSRRMDALRAMSEQFSSDIEAETVQLLLAQRQEITYLVLITSLLLLVSAVSCYLLIRSVTEPVKNLTKALTVLSTGDRSIVLNQQLAEDELKQMSTAYELCRVGMLKYYYEHIHVLLSNQEVGRYKKLSATDSLTGEFNRRKFDEMAEREVVRARRYQRPLAAMMLDIDHFKHINDKYGHGQGDYIIKVVSDCCREQIRGCDLLARLGGDEFAILVLETTREQILYLAERIRGQIADHSFVLNNEHFNITVSIGVVQFDCINNEISLDGLMNLADKELYKAKNSGRNRVFLAP